MERALGPLRTDALAAIGAAAERHGAGAFLVGGVVRDIILGFPVTDLDVTVEGDAVEVAREWAQSAGGTVKGLTRFGTCKVDAGPAGVIDFASTRTENYKRPGALPDVAPSDIESDLARRDFALNAMAVDLSPGSYGELLDPFNGWDDIRKRELRVLHDKSFTDDPTRVLRGIRFAARYGYRFNPATGVLVADCVSGGCLRTISGKRLLRELRLIFLEEKAASGLKLLDKHGVLESISPDLALGSRKRKMIPAARTALGKFRSGEARKVINPGAFWLGFLFIGVEPASGLELLRYLNPDRRTRDVSLWACRELGAARARLSKLTPPHAYKATRLLRNVLPESLALLYTASTGKVRRIVGTYFTRWRHVKPLLRGADLVRLGVRRGPAVGGMLNRMLRLKLEGRLPTRNSEIAYVRRRVRTRR
jgi:tRNA nucleotidyltransferase (CCA-adding enzyme)